MATKKSGALIKVARSRSGMTQEKLASKADCGLTAADISRIERGEGSLSQAQAKELAAILGITQSSLLDALKADSGIKASSVSALMTKTAKASSGASKSTAKKASSSAKSSVSAASHAKNSVQDFSLSAAEKKLVSLYRNADKNTREKAIKILQGETDADLLGDLLGGAGDVLGSLAGAAIENLLNRK